MNANEIEIGMTVKYKNMRGSVRLVYPDAPYVAVIVFPQDISWRGNLRFQDWPIGSELATYSYTETGR